MTAVDTAPLVPSFDAPEGSGRKLAIICSKGNLDMAYPGLILANAAVGEGVETHLFFTFWGFDIITKATMADLKFSFVGNTAMHPPGHSGLGVHHMLGALPGATTAATMLMKKQLADLDVPEVPEFLDLLVGSGAHLWACRMSADMNHLTADDLHEGVEGIISAGDFIELTEGAQLLFI
ncbi:DsrE/DsrF/DrsH-like family protein [Phycicoccus duodecadis]|uniref:Peroxiredoxin family protein n=1 Tax=Phycicoccus duodecadis TaxID=173053 RepID=A0A2N3YGN3_9MICO|nr:DsrE/DsrF/DrsH-like family protein [Phycicoccus duodecadis]PKW26001.1 peroxiredoxin family protein [Phycicoccus duodecadis]